jgi:hypothetical protein
MILTHSLKPLIMLAALCADSAFKAQNGLTDARLRSILTQTTSANWEIMKGTSQMFVEEITGLPLHSFNVFH